MQTLNAFDMLATRYPNGVHKLGEDPAKWAKNARLDWEIKSSQTAFTPDGKRMALFPGKQTFFRSDTEDPLAIVGKRFKPVQPAHMLELYTSMAKAYGFELALAGEIKNGQKIWAMAKTPHHLELVKGDKVEGCFIFATACDGSLSTQGFFQSFRIWCTNQLPVLLRAVQKGKGPLALRGFAKPRLSVFKISHSRDFIPQNVVDRDLEVMKVSWDDFKRVAEALANKKVTRPQALEFLSRYFYKGDEPKLEEHHVADMIDRSTMKRVWGTYEQGEGQKAITGTAWGVVNAVTRYMDHETNYRSDDLRVRGAWFNGARDKAAIYQDAVQTFVPTLLKPAA